MHYTRSLLFTAIVNGRAFQTVDLTAVPGVSSLTAHTLLTEVGPDLRRFPNAAAFASWLGLCPDNRISGGRVLSVVTRKVKNRLTIALRMAAQSLHGASPTLDSISDACAFGWALPQLSPPLLTNSHESCITSSLPGNHMKKAHLPLWKNVRDNDSSCA